LMNICHEILCRGEKTTVKSRQDLLLKELRSKVMSRELAELPGLADAAGLLGMEEVIDLVIERDESSKKFALLAAAALGRTDLIIRRCKVMSKTEMQNIHKFNGTRLLSVAAIYGHEELMKELIKIYIKLGLELIDFNKNETSSLAWASARGYLGCVRLILEHKEVLQYINVPSSRNCAKKNQNALVLSCIFEHYDVAMTLMEKGAAFGQYWRLSEKERNKFELSLKPLSVEISNRRLISPWIMFCVTEHVFDGLTRLIVWLRESFPNCIRLASIQVADTDRKIWLQFQDFVSAFNAFEKVKCTIQNVRFEGFKEETCLTLFAHLPNCLKMDQAKILESEIKDQFPRSWSVNVIVPKGKKQLICFINFRTNEDAALDLQVSRGILTVCRRACFVTFSKK
jgi:hypothetical protein